PTTGKRVNRKGTNIKRDNLTTDDFVIVKDNHEALIDHDLWERVQAKLAGNRKCTSPQTSHGPWLLAGLLVCGCCGGNMFGSSYGKPRQHKTGRGYIGGKYHQNGLNACHIHNVKEGPIVKLLVRKLQEDFLNPDNFHELREELRRQLAQASGEA